MTAGRIIAYIAAAIVLLFGVLFIWAAFGAEFNSGWLITGLISVGIGFGLICSLLGGYAWWLDSLLGALVGALLPALVIVIYKLLRGIEGMGWGDVKYLAAIGAVVGLHGVVGVLVIGATVGALFGLGLIIAGRGSGKTELPFGTFLALAAIVWLYAPSSWFSWL